MEGTPVLAFSAYSGTGKTTLIEKLTAELKRRSFRIAVVKHDGHDFEIDYPGKDSWRYTQAGADVSMIISSQKTAVIETRRLSAYQAMERIRDVDLILIEGYKDLPFSQIGICRRDTKKGFPSNISRYVAVVTDTEIASGTVPHFDLNDIGPLAEFVTENMKDFTRLNGQGGVRGMDVEENPSVHGIAVAEGRVEVNPETFHLIQNGGIKNGDVLTEAQVAGVMAAKRTWELIPLCHPAQIGGIDLRLTLDEASFCVNISTAVSCDGKTDGEMEALSAVSAAALTVCDMCKAVQRDIQIASIRLVKKSGGVHGDFRGEKEG